MNIPNLVEFLSIYLIDVMFLIFKGLIIILIFGIGSVLLKFIINILSVVFPTKSYRFFSKPNLFFERLLALAKILISLFVGVFLVCGLIYGIISFVEKVLTREMATIIGFAPLIFFRRA